MKKILVTGGAGFIGSHLCEALSAKSGHEVYSLDNYFYKIRNSFELAYPINKKIDFSLVYKIENEFNVVDPFTLFIFEPKISYKL